MMPTCNPTLVLLNEWDRYHHRFPQCCWMAWRTQISHISPVLLNDMKDTDITHFPIAAEWHEGRRCHTFPQCCWMTWRTQMSHIFPVQLNDMKDADSIIGFPNATEWHEGQIALQVSPVLLNDMKDTDITLFPSAAEWHEGQIAS